VWSVRLSYDDRYYDVCYGDFYDESEFKCNFQPFVDFIQANTGDFYAFCFP